LDSSTKTSTLKVRIGIESENCKLDGRTRKIHKDQSDH